MPRVLGLDHGERRLGFAVSDPDGILAIPLCVVEVRSDAEAVREVARLARETESEEIVVGLPISMNGTEGAMAAKVRAFVAALAKQVAIPIAAWDERLTTSQVERALVNADVSRRRRKNVRDKLAAQVILQSYLDSRAARKARAAADDERALATS